MYRLIFLVVFLIGCSNLRPVNYIDVEFIPYVKKFESLYGRPISKMSIVLSNLKDAAGTCYLMSNSRKIIRIDSDTWNAYSNFPSGREELIFHELGHCELYRRHIDNMIEIDGQEVPESIMHSTLFAPTDLYEKYHDHYMSELFDESKFNTINNHSNCFKILLDK